MALLGHPGDDEVGGLDKSLGTILQALLRSVSPWTAATSGGSARR